MSDQNPSFPTSIFFKRIAAYLVDFALLSAAGWVLGQVAGDELSAYWPWSTLIGFVLSCLYFGAGNSRWKNGQTFGKKLLRIRVVGKDGAPISFGRSFIRAVFLSFPYTLNSLLMPHFWSGSWIIQFLSFLSLALLTGDLYFFVFNRRNRQALHDFVMKTFVVRAETAAESVGSLPETPRVHQVVLIALTLSWAVFIFSVIPSWAKQEPAATFISVQEALADHPSIQYAVIHGNRVVLDVEGQKVPRKYLNIMVLWKNPLVEEEEEAAALEVIRMINPEIFSPFDLVSVTLMTGYDLGIASNYRNARFTGSPSEWIKKTKALVP